MTESESEVEEDCDLWVDEAVRQWMRTAAFRGRWYCLVLAPMGRSGGMSPVRVRGERYGAAAGFQGFFIARRYATTGAVEVLTEPVSLFMRQSTVASG